MNTAESIEYVTCRACGKTVEKRAWNQVESCGEQKCKDRIKKIKAHERRSTLPPAERGDSVAYRLRNRERNAEWAMEHRNVTTPNPWLIGQPIYPATLPGRVLSMELLSRVRFPIALRNARLVHGMVTACLGQDHSKIFPAFSLVPTDCGLKVYVHQADWTVIADKTMQAMIAKQDVKVRFFDTCEMRAPQVTKRGHRVVTIESITPVSCRNRGGETVYTEPTEENLLGTLRSSLAPRLGLAKLPHENIVLRLLDHKTTTETVDLGGKYHVKPVVGWHGKVVVDCNAVSHWLLECAARGWGLGGRTAFGFGRVRVEAERTTRT